MRLEVELAHVSRRGNAPHGQVIEIVLRSRHAGERHTLQICAACHILEVIARRASAPVSPTKRHQTGGDIILLDALRPAQDQRRGIGLGVVLVVQMHEHAGAVNAFPVERVQREGIATVIDPKDLVGGEVVDATAAHDLWQASGIAKDIRQPEQLRIDAEFVLDEPLAIQELTDQALTAGEVGVRLHPHAPVHNPLPPCYGVLNPGVDLRMALLHPPVQVRLALQKLELWVLVHEGQLRAKGAHALALGFLQMPQPGNVDVRMAEQEQLWCRIAVVGLEQRRQAFSRLAGRGH